MPENYVEDEPEDLEAIRVNARLLKEVLDPHQDKYGVRNANRLEYIRYVHACALP